MSVYAVKDPRNSAVYYFISISIKGMPRIRESTGIGINEPDAKQRAQEYHDRRKAEAWRQVKLGERPLYTWEQAVVRWLSEHQDKRSLRMDLARLRWLDPHLRGQPLQLIDRDLVDQVMARKQRDGCRPATINRHAAVVRAILNAACHEWGWIDHAPRIRMREENNDRITWMTQREAYEILLPNLAKTAPHLYDAAEFTLHTGLRDNNVATLRWDQVSEDGSALFIYATKNGEPIGTPLNTVARSVLQRRHGIDAVHVFTWNGKPVTRFNNTAWRNALSRTLLQIGDPLPARLLGFTWHSLRHTWASWCMQNGMPIEKLMILGGWRHISMAQRYSHLATEHLMPYSELVAESTRSMRSTR